MVRQLWDCWRSTSAKYSSPKNPRHVHVLLHSSAQDDQASVRDSLNGRVHDEVVSYTQRTITRLIQYHEADIAPDSGSRLKSISLSRIEPAPGEND